VILPDVNVLVSAARDDTPDAAAYRAWLQECLGGPEPVAVVAPVVSGFLRVVTNPRIFERPSSLDQALGFVEAVLAAPASIAPPLEDGAVRTLLDMCRRADVKGARVADAYLAAIAVDLDAELVTADRDFGRFPGLRWRHPLEGGG